MKITKKKVEELIQESYITFLLEEEKATQLKKNQQKSTKLKKGQDIEDVKGVEDSSAILEDATEEMLEKFPILKQTLIKLMSEEFKEFVDVIDWISPRPTAFKINLTNAQNFILTWQGDDFVANIMGKNFDLTKISEFQQALDKLAILYRQAPIDQDNEEEFSNSDNNTSSSSTSGGKFPGDEKLNNSEFEEPSEESSGEEESGGKDLSGEEVSFDDGDEPEI